LKSEYAKLIGIKEKSAEKMPNKLASQMTFKNDKGNNLSVADLLQIESVSLLNSKLEQKNTKLEDQINQL